MESCTSCHTRPRKELLANLPDSCCCKKTQRTAGILPTSCQRRSHMPSHVLKNLIHTLNLPTGLRVIRGTEHNCRTNRLLEGLPELGGEKTASIRTNLLWDAMQRYNSCGIQLRQLSC